MTSKVHYVPVGGVRLRAHVRPGSGTPLVMISGIGTDLESLDTLLEHLDERRTIIRLDMPRARRSSDSVVLYTIPLLAHWIGKALDRLGYTGRFDVVGYSWGGAVAQQLALQNPRRCRRLVLVATSTGALMIPARPAVLTKMLTPRRFTDPDYLATIAGNIYGGSAAHEPAALAHLARRHALGGSGRGYLYQLLALATWTSLFALPAIRQPTLIITGADDPLIPLVNARIMRRLLPHATLHIHPGGHLEPLIEPARFAALIDAFLPQRR